MRSLWDASQPYGYRSLENRELCNRHSTERSMKEAIESAIALHCTLNVHGDVLERDEVFKYLGRLLAQDDDDAQAVWLQTQKAWGVWARVGQVLRAENAAPQVAAKFYSLCVGKNVFLGFLAGLRLVVIFTRWSKYIENAKFCAEFNGGGVFIKNHRIPFEFNSPLLKFVA